MQLSINTADPRPIYVQIMDEIRRAVVLGTLRPDDALPSVRQLAGDLRVNPNTVAQAYRELEREGITYVQRGQGTFVAAKDAAAPPDRSALTAGLVRWIRQAQAAGCDQDDVAALFAAATRETFGRRAA